MMWHVSSSLNRASIQEHGLDSSRMGAARGIAGATRPEVDGVFLSADEFDADFFIQMNAPAGLLDLWAVDDVDPAALRDNGHGFFYLPGAIAASQVRLARADIEPEPWPESAGSDGVYSGRLTTTCDGPR